MKMRLDNLLVEKGLTESRSQAQRLIMAGEVLIEGKIKDKPGTQFDTDVAVELKDKFPYVSRGALKLLKAIDEFKIDLKNKTICDIGASTGGFTDLTLQRGAKKVYSIDVGHGQLDLRLRNNSKVVVMEKTDFRSLNKLPEKIDFFVIDVSFISLTKILNHLKKLTDAEGLIDYQIIALVKPQFEVGKKEADRGRGIITDDSLHQKVIGEIKENAESLGYKVLNICQSPILGAKGNKEYLIYLAN